MTAAIRQIPLPVLKAVRKRLHARRWYGIMQSMWAAIFWAALTAGILSAGAAYFINQLPRVNIPVWINVIVVLVLIGASAFITYQLSKPSRVTLTMDDFTDACRRPYPIGPGDPRAVAQVVPTDPTQELPSYWVKCIVDGNNLGGVDLDRYCAFRKAGTHSDNPERDGPAADQPWLKWRCVSS
jgi:hypothetical protein